MPWWVEEAAGLASLLYATRIGELVMHADEGYGFMTGMAKRGSNPIRFWHCHYMQGALSVAN